MAIFFCGNFSIQLTAFNDEVNVAEAGDADRINDGFRWVGWVGWVSTSRHRTFPNQRNHIRTTSNQPILLLSDDNDDDGWGW